MFADIKKLWVDALRSGEFEQTKGSLRDETGHCCLGVLCELHQRANPDSTGGGWSHNYLMENTYRYDGQANILPVSVRNWAGLDTYSPTVLANEDVGECSLAELNDKHFDFKQIAETIEEHL